MGFQPQSFDEAAHGEQQDTEPVEFATPGQVKYMIDLLSKLQREGGEYGRKTVESFNARMTEKGYTELEEIEKAKATVLIDWLKEHLATARSTTSTTATANQDVPEGVHYADGKVYKVQKARTSGRKYAKMLVHPLLTTPHEPPENISWEYVGMPSKVGLSPNTLMTKEDAALYGKMYGVCANCGALLTNEDSIERGIGPICAERFG